MKHESILWLSPVLLIVGAVLYLRHIASGGHKKGKKADDAIHGTQAYPLLAAATALAAAASLIYTWRWRSAVVNSTNGLPLKLDSPALHFLFWTFGPPLFFVFEFWNIYKGGAEIADKDRFKTSQDLGTKFWAAVAIVIGALYKLA